MAFTPALLDDVPSQHAAALFSQGAASAALLAGLRVAFQGCCCASMAGAPRMLLPTAAAASPDGR